MLSQCAACAKLSPVFSFFCAMVAAMTLKFLDPFGSGKLVLFQVTYDKVRLFVPTSYLTNCAPRIGTRMSSFPSCSSVYSE